ncbi:hypothetical protein N0V93_008194 [Gnomoniopsis smithogilvyi]|uniref:Zinc-binding loop region of homing endonuclease domain-containing protein n=1 Tax=Gnomoniopsis smithogilvyi TaxID=1191159 RepID=A0A9W8YMH2_9PEZI|nr:hypothetical protein N0V93_008194 [Gnomoniopsis smithogilvyi]
MPVKYEIRTEVRPPVRDFNTGAMIDPGGAGRLFIILPDGSPMRLGKNRRIKAEEAARSHFQTPDIKSEDEVEDEDVGMILSATRQRTTHTAAGSSIRLVAGEYTGQPRDRILHREQAQSSQINDSHSDDSSSGDSDTSITSDEESLDDVPAEQKNGSVFDRSSVFRPSRSPSRPLSTSSKTRSRNKVKEGKNHDSDVQTTPTPSSKNNTTSSTTSVQKPPPPSLPFFIPIRSTNSQNGPHRQVESQASASMHVSQSVPSPATSRVGGWRPINKQKPKSKLTQAVDLTDFRGVPTAPAAMRPSSQCQMQQEASSRQYRAATAGPSTEPKSGPIHGPAVVSSQKSKGGSSSQPSSQNQDPPGDRSQHEAATCRQITPEVMLVSDPSLPGSRSPKGKGKAMASTADSQLERTPQNHCAQDEARSCKSKKKTKKGYKSPDKRKKDRWRSQISKTKNSPKASRHGPTRKARVERSIEGPATPGLLTPGPSSATRNTFELAGLSPARSESGMFVTSPLQPATPGPSTVSRAAIAANTPRMSPVLADLVTPDTTSLIRHQSRKRSRSVFESDDDAAINTAADRILKRFEVMITAGTDRLERQVVGQVANIRSELQAERKTFEQGLEKRLCEIRGGSQGERLRLEDALAKQEAHFVSLHSQIKEENQRLGKQINIQGDGIGHLKRKLSSQQEQSDHSKKRADRHEAHLTATKTHFKEQVERVEGKVDEQESRISSVEVKFPEEMNRVKNLVDDQGTYISTVRDQVQERSDKMEKAIDGQGARLGVLNAQLDGQRAKNRVFTTQFEGQQQKLVAVESEVGHHKQSLIAFGNRINENKQGVDSVRARMADQARKFNELKQMVEKMERQAQISQEITDTRLNRLESSDSHNGRASNSQASGPNKAQVREVRPREYLDLGARGRPIKPGIPDTLIRSDYGKPNPRVLPNLIRRDPAYSGSQVLGTTQPAAQHASSSGRCNEGALHLNRSNLVPQAQQQTTHKSSIVGLITPRSSQSSSQPASSYQIRGVEPGPVELQPASSSPSELRSSPSQPQPSQRRSQYSRVQARHEPEPSPTPTPPTTSLQSNRNTGINGRSQQDMKELVLRYPLSGLTFSINYEKDIDGDQTSEATAFLLNVPLQVIFNRFQTYMNRPAFAFNLRDADAHAKGCWMVRAERQQDSQFKLYYNERNYAFTLTRLAVRMWHNEESVLRLLLSKNHKAVHLCHNKLCFNPEHIVVESQKEHTDRLSCVKDGRCRGHPIWSKYGQIDARRRCIFS